MGRTTAAFEARDFGPLWLVGRAVTVRLGSGAESFVKALRADGTLAALERLPERVSPPGDLLIWMGEYDGGTRCFTEIPGVLVRPGCPVPEGLTVRPLPPCTMGVCTVTGPTRDLARGAHGKLLRLMEKAGYAPDYGPGFSVEYYSRERYERENAVYAFSYWLPCRKKEA